MAATVTATLTITKSSAKTPIVCAPTANVRMKRWKCVGSGSVPVIVVVFVVLFIGGDVDWFWNIVISEKDIGMLTWPMPKII